MDYNTTKYATLEHRSFGMSRQKPAPQDVGVQLNASIPLRVKDELEERAKLANLSVSKYLTGILKEQFGFV